MVSGAWITSNLTKCWSLQQKEPQCKSHWLLGLNIH